MAIIRRIKIESFEKVATLPLSMIVGPTGNPGLPGTKGSKGDRGKQGLRGLQGLRGAKGEMGTSVLLEDLIEQLKVDKDFIAATKGKDGESHGWVGGSTSPVKYEQITNSTYTIRASSLVDGMNIFGVVTDTATTVYLPSNIRETQLIVINDETGSASTNNITVQVI